MNDNIPDNLDFYDMYEAERERQKRVAIKNAMNEQAYERELEESKNE